MQSACHYLLACLLSIYTCNYLRYKFMLTWLPSKGSSAPTPLDVDHAGEETLYIQPPHASQTGTEVTQNTSSPKFSPGNNFFFCFFTYYTCQPETIS